MDRVSWQYQQDVKEEVVRRVLLKGRDFVGAAVDARGLVQGDVRLSPEQVLQRALINMQTGVQDVKEVIAPHMAKQDMTDVRQATAKLTRH